MFWDFTPTRIDWIRAIVHDNWMCYQNGFPLPGRRISIGWTGQTNFLELTP